MYAKKLSLCFIFLSSAAFCNAELDCPERPVIGADVNFGKLIADCTGEQYIGNFCFDECQNFCPDSGACPYPGIPIGCWDTSQVTNMVDAFSYYGKDCPTKFNEPVDMWDTSRVTDMKGLFTDASKFNQPIDSWDTSNVRNMDSMFYPARSFNQALNSWNVGSVTSMADMFNIAESFNQPLDNWNVSSVRDFGGMFGTTNFRGFTNGTLIPTVVPFNQPIDSWDVSSATQMLGMFQYNIFFNQPLDSWDISNVGTLAAMFRGATKFNQCLSTWPAKAVGERQYFSNIVQEASTAFRGDVETGMFFESGCPAKAQNSIPIPGEGPWCQSEEDGCFTPPPTVAPAGPVTNAPSESPTERTCGAIEDPKAKFQTGKKQKTCRSLDKKLSKKPNNEKVIKNTQKKCNKKSTNGEKVFDICPVTCGRVGRGDCAFLEDEE